MKRLSITAATAGVTLALVTAAALAATKPIAFVGTFKGTATTNQTDTTVAISANGTGTGTLLGATKITGKGTGNTSVRPCIPFTGTGSMRGAKGTIIFKVLPTSTSCGDEAGQLFTFTGKAQILKATGTLLKRKGTLKLTGTYDRDSGAFTAKFKGSLIK